MLFFIKGAPSIGLMLWFLAREVLRIRGTLTRTEPWDVMCDLFFYRDQEEQVKEEPQAAVEAHDQYDQIQAQTDNQDWDQNSTTIGQNITLQPGFAANEDWNQDENWNKGAPAENWNAPAAQVAWNS